MGGNSTSCRWVLGIVRKSHLSAPGGRCSLKIGKRLEFPLDLTGCAWLLVLVQVLVCWIRPLKQINEVQHPSHDGILTPERLEPLQPVFFSQYLLPHLVPFNSIKTMLFLFFYSLALIFCSPEFVLLFATLISSITLDLFMTIWTFVWPMASMIFIILS